jgi:hypothetical protein
MNADNATFGKFKVGDIPISIDDVANIGNSLNRLKLLQKVCMKLALTFVKHLTLFVMS